MSLMTTNSDTFRLSIPEDLRERSQWVAWKYVKRNGRRTKVPVNPITGGFAKSTDPQSWGSFEQAIAACQSNAKLAGVGFVFSADDPYCGVDLDKCIDVETGTLSDWAIEIVQQLDSYTEISPSGTGLKIFLNANKPGQRCRKAYHYGEVEIYDAGRFFTVTGQHWEQARLDVADRQTEVDQFYRTVFGEDATACKVPTPSSNNDVHLADDEIIDIASKQRRTGEKFSDLWAGQWNVHFNSASEADSSVVFTLAFYTKDAGQIDRIFRQSGLMRPKWDEMHGAETYGDITIANALQEVTRQYKPKQRRVLNQDDSILSLISNPDRPRILVSNRQLEDITFEALAAMEDANDPPQVFVRGRTLARVLCDERGVVSIQSMDSHAVRSRLSEVANFFALRKHEGELVEVSTNPPNTLSENILVQPEWNFPPLAGISLTPIVHEDGTIFTDTGYDPVSKLYYYPAANLNLVPIAENPCRSEIEACVDMLLEVINEFPFVDLASRANALAILFSLVLRPVIKGQVPLVIVDAPMQGTGKSLLVTNLARIALGSVPTEAIPAKQNDDEWRKKVTSLLKHSRSFILLDNIPDNTKIDSPTLAVALTSHEWSDRLLGGNEVVQYPCRAVWAASGNNLRVTGDLPRRSYSVRLDAEAERPWERTGFQIKELDQFVDQHRGKLLSAALTIIRGWYTHGKPKAKVPTLGSFQEWADLIGSVLQFAGIEGFLANLERTQVVQDEDGQQWIAFFDFWWEQFADKSVMADDICQLVFPPQENFLDQVDPEVQVPLPEPLLECRDKGQGSFKRSLGRNLSRLTGRIFSDRKLSDAGTDKTKHVRKWRLIERNQNVQGQLWNGESQ